MSTSRISAGLRQREEASASAVPLAALRGGPATISDLNTLASQASAKVARLRELADGVSRHMATFEARKRAELDGLGKTTNDNGTVTDALGHVRRGKLLRDAVRQERQNAVAVGEEERASLAAELRDISSRVDAVRDLHEDAVAVLKMNALGSAKVAAYRDDLAHAGPVEVEAAMRRAVLTQDKDLGAACLRRLDAMPKGARDSVRVSRADLADTLVGADVRRARMNLMAVEIASGEAEMAVATVEGRDVPSHRKIAIGIKQREFAELHAAVEADAGRAEAA